MKPEVFERALHAWDPWLSSIKDGRSALRSTNAHPSLERMRILAQTNLRALGFEPCGLFELYWLCCIFSDYDAEYAKNSNHREFRFNKLILPEWFPLPYGFHCEQDAHLYPLDFRGKRIMPCEVWSEADREWRVRQSMRIYPAVMISRDGPIPFDRRGPAEREVADYRADWAIVLPRNHPVNEFVKKGRPSRPMGDGLVSVE